MGTKTYNNYEDLITFTRASKGHALRPVSYGTELVTNGDGSSVTNWNSPRSNSTLSVNSGRLRATASASGAYGIAQTLSNLTVGAIYFYSANIYADGGSGNMIFRISALATLDNQPVSDEQSTTRLVSGSFVATASTMYVGGIHVASSAGDYIELDNVSVKEVTFDESDGTLTLFEHPNNIPRVEWDADRNRLGLLVEEARTNLVTYSEDFDNAAWSDTRGDVVSVTITDPAGQQNAFSWTSNDSAESYIADNTTISSGATVTFSGFVKKNTADYCHLLVWDSSANGCRVWFDLDNGQVGTNTSFGSTFTVSGSSITEYPNGWYRCSMTVSTSGSTTAQVRFQPSDGDGVIASSVGKSIYIYGAQVEEASFPTSYIKTTGATATRSADVASIPVADFGFNADAGSVVLEAESAYLNGIGRTFVLSDGTTNNRIQSVAYFNSHLGVVSGGVTQANIDAGTFAQDVFSKFSGAYKQNDFSASIDGGAAVTDTAGDVPSNITTMNIGSAFGTSAFLNGHIKSIKYYPRRLTNAQLVELTS